MCIHEDGMCCYEDGMCSDDDNMTLQYLLWTFKMATDCESKIEYKIKSVALPPLSYDANELI